MEDLIIKNAKNLFFSYGVKGVSMDDVAKKAGVSKKTVYKCFQDKNQLIGRLISDLLVCHQHALCHCFELAQDAIDEVLLCSRTPFNTVAVINPGFFYEIQKFFPAAQQLLTKYTEEVLVPAIIKNLEKGIKQELYRPELDVSFAADLRMQQVLTALNPKLLTNRIQENSSLILQLSEFYLHGITTQKGKQLIIKYLNANNENRFSN